MPPCLITADTYANAASIDYRAMLARARAIKSVKNGKRFPPHLFVLVENLQSHTWRELWENVHGR